MRWLVQLDDADGLLFEAEVPEALAQQAGTGKTVIPVDKGIDSLLFTLRRLLKPFASVWKELSQDAEIEETLVKVSFGITAEGNFFVAKGQMEGNLSVEMKIKPLPKNATS